MKTKQGVEVEVVGRVQVGSNALGGICIRKYTASSGWVFSPTTLLFLKESKIIDRKNVRKEKLEGILSAGM